MKRILMIGILSAWLNCTLWGQTDEQEPVHYRIKLYTMNGNFIDGMLLNVADSSVSIYPGTHLQWKKRQPFSTAVFEYQHIREVRLKRKTGDTGPVGTVVPISEGIKIGIVTTASYKKKYLINGSKDCFDQFISDIR